MYDAAAILCNDLFCLQLKCDNDLIISFNSLPQLSLARLCKHHTCRPEVNQRISKAAHIKELNSEIDKLKEELFATREKNGVYLPADHWESQQVGCANSSLMNMLLSNCVPRE